MALPISTSRVRRFADVTPTIEPTSLIRELVYDVGGIKIVTEKLYASDVTGIFVLRSRYSDLPLLSTV